MNRVAFNSDHAIMKHIKTIQWQKQNNMCCSRRVQSSTIALIVSDVYTHYCSKVWGISSSVDANSGLTIAFHQMWIEILLLCEVRNQLRQSLDFGSLYRKENSVFIHILCDYIACKLGTYTRAWRLEQSGFVYLPWLLSHSQHVCEHCVLLLVDSRTALKQSKKHKRP